MTNDEVSVKSEMKRGQCVHTTAQAWPRVDSRELCRFTAQPERSRSVPASHDYNMLFQKDEKMEEAKSPRGQGVWCAATGQVGVSLSSICRGVFPPVVSRCLSGLRGARIPSLKSYPQPFILWNRAAGAGSCFLFNSLIPGFILTVELQDRRGNTRSCLGLIEKKEKSSYPRIFTPTTHFLPWPSGQLWVLIFVTSLPCTLPQKLTFPPLVLRCWTSVDTVPPRYCFWNRWASQHWHSELERPDSRWQFQGRG